MNATFAAACALYALALAVVVLVDGARARTRSRHLATAVAVLELCLLAQALHVVIARLDGVEPTEPAVHLGYTASSVLLIPIAFGVVGRDTSFWASTAVAVALVAVVVVVMRMQTTWAHG